MKLFETLHDDFVPFACQSLKEPVVSVAAGLRHSLAATRKFLSHLPSLSCMEVDEEIQNNLPALPSDSGRVYQWGTGLMSHAKRALSPEPVPAHLGSVVPSLVPGGYTSCEHVGTECRTWKYLL